MAIEHASVQVARKPWGVADLNPWSGIDASGDAVGELWFQRVDKNAPAPTLLLKLLFTSEPLSIQVHPDDAFARSIGLANGKTEAWYILSATPDARVAVGLKRSLTPQQLRAAIRDGSIAGLTRWRSVDKGDVIFVPAGTIHAIGSGIVLAEIQQHSDATFRLFDYGRQRELHEDSAVAVSDAGPVQISGRSATPHRGSNRPDRKPAFCTRADRPSGELELDARCEAGNLDPGDRRTRTHRPHQARRSAMPSLPKRIAPTSPSGPPG